MQMPGNQEAPTPGLGMVQFALKVLDATLEVRGQLPEGEVRPQVLLPILRSVSDSMSEIATHNASRLGEKISCREGCGACCRQAVPISAVEARALAEWLKQLPEERQAVLRARFRQAAARLEESGIAATVRAWNQMPLDLDAMHELGLKYFALGLACPFLEEERCTIHEIRPLRCREYLVVSPAEHCAHPESWEIVAIKPPVLLSRILSRWDANGDAQTPELILLAQLEEWAARHSADRELPHRTSPELLKEFLRGFARDASAAPADPRSTEPPDVLPPRSDA
jgi:Fe-S-cluster containining protein